MPEAGYPVLTVYENGLPVTSIGGCPGGLQGLLGGGERQIKRLVFKTIPDIATRVAALQTGAVDIIGEGGIPPAFITQLERDPSVRLSYAKGGATNMHIGFEARKGAPLADRRVRLAIAHAIDVDAIVKNVLGGRAQKTAALVTPYTVGYDPAIKGIPYDPEAAKKLLAEAGYASGIDVTFNSSGGRDVNEREVVEALAAQMQAVGIRAKVNYLEWGAYMAKRRDTMTRADMFMLRWSTGGKMDADTQLYAILKCKGALRQLLRRAAGQAPGDHHQRDGSGGPEQAVVASPAVHRRPGADHPALRSRRRVRRREAGLELRGTLGLPHLPPRSTREALTACM